MAGGRPAEGLWTECGGGRTSRPVEPPHDAGPGAGGAEEPARSPQSRARSLRSRTVPTRSASRQTTSTPTASAASAHQLGSAGHARTYTPAELLAGLAGATKGWQVEVAQERWREVPGPDGEAGRRSDAVICLRRPV